MVKFITSWGRVWWKMDHTLEIIWHEHREQAIQKTWGFRRPYRENQSLQLVLKWSSPYGYLKNRIQFLLKVVENLLLISSVIYKHGNRKQVHTTKSQSWEITVGIPGFFSEIWVEYAKTSAPRLKPDHLYFPLYIGSYTSLRSFQHSKVLSKSTFSTDSQPRRRYHCHSDRPPPLTHSRPFQLNHLLKTLEEALFRMWPSERPSSECVIPSDTLAFDNLSCEKSLCTKEKQSVPKEFWP